MLFISELICDILSIKSSAQRTNFISSPFFISFNHALGVKWQSPNAVPHITFSFNFHGDALKKEKKKQHQPNFTSNFPGKIC